MQLLHSCFYGMHLNSEQENKNNCTKKQNPYEMNVYKWVGGGIYWKKWAYEIVEASKSKICKVDQQTGDPKKR